VWIRRAEITGFGKLIDRKLQFAEGLNCVFGPNEAGKTTLQAFLISMLYGQATAGLKNRILDGMNAKYLPGKAFAYGGNLALVLGSGRELLIRRSFAGNADEIDLSDARTGQSVLKTYFRNHHREYQFVQKESRVDKGTFESVFVIAHDSVGELRAAEDKNVADRLIALADTGDSKGGAGAAQKALSEARAAIGTARAATRPYARTRDDLQKARELLERVKAARAEYSQALMRRSELSAKIATSEAELARASALLIYSKAAALASIDSERKELAAEEARLVPAESLPADITRATVSVAQSRLTDAQRRLTQAAADETAAAKALAGAEIAMSATGIFASLDDVKLRAAEDAVVDFVERRTKLQDILRRLDEISEKLKSLAGKWSANRETLEAVTADDESFLSQARERKAALAEQSARAASEVASCRVKTGRACLAVGISGGIAVAFAITAAVIAATVSSGARGPVAITFAILALVAAVVLASRLRWAKAARLGFADAESRAVRVRAEIEGLDSRVAALISSIKAENVESALALLREFHDDHRRCDELGADADRLNGEAERTLAGARDAQSAMSQACSFVSLSAGESLAAAAACLISGENHAIEQLDWSEAFADAISPSFVRDAFKPLWAKSREAATARSRLASAADTLAKLRTAHETAREERDTSSNALQELLDRSGVSAVPALEARVDDRARLGKVRDRLRVLADKERMVLAGIDREAFSRQLLAAPPLAADQTLIGESAIQSADRALEARTRALEADKRDLAAVNATVSEGLKNLPEMPEIEERISELEERARLQDRHRDALDNAFRIVTDAASAFHGEVYPKIEASLTSALKSLTLGAHEEAHVWSDDTGGVRALRISVVDRDKGAPVEPQALSQGTLEQVYLCARLALMEALSTGDELPVMLDDPFINYDTGRLRAGIELIAKVAARHQVFLFTCQEDVRDLAQAAGGTVVTL